MSHEEDNKFNQKVTREEFFTVKYPIEMKEIKALGKEKVALDIFTFLANDVENIAEIALKAIQNNENVLHVLATNGEHKLLEEALSFVDKKYINSKNIKGKTPLELVLEKLIDDNKHNKHEDVKSNIKKAQLLIEHGADPHIEQTVCDQTKIILEKQLADFDKEDLNPEKELADKDKNKFKETLKTLIDKLKPKVVLINIKRTKASTNLSTKTPTNKSKSRYPFLNSIIRGLF